MKAADPALIALLDSGDPFVMWEVYTITLADGTVLTWSTTELPPEGLPAPSESEVTLTG